MDSVLSFLGGKYIIDNTAPTFVNNTDLTVVHTLDSNEMALLFHIDTKNADNVTRPVLFFITDSSDNTVLMLGDSQNVLTGDFLTHPNGLAGANKSKAVPIAVPAGYKIKVKHTANGASTGGTGFTTFNLVSLG